MKKWIKLKSYRHFQVSHESFITVVNLDRPKFPDHGVYIGLYAVTSLGPFGITKQYLGHFLDILDPPKCHELRILLSTDVTTRGSSKILIEVYIQ